MAETSPHQFPALREFVRGYFHQDLESEYGSPQAAVRQFLHDADAEQRKAVAKEWATLLGKTQHLGEINEALRRLGSAWTFASLADVNKIAEIFREDSLEE